MKCIINSMKPKYRLNPYMIEMILHICKCFQSIMPVTNIGTEKLHKVSEVYHKVHEAKIKVESIHG